MTIIDRVSTTTAAAVPFVSPITSGLVGQFQPRVDAARSIINHANSASPGVLAGSGVTYSPWSAFLSPSGYIDTTLPETLEFSIVAVVRKTLTGGFSVASTLAGSVFSTPFSHLYARTTSPIRFFSGSKTTPVTSDSALGHDFVDTNFEMISSSTSATQNTLMMPRNPASVAGGNPRTITLSGTRDTPTRNWRIGANFVASGGAQPNGTDIAMVMFFNRAISEIEVRAIYAEARRYYLARGITI